MFAATSLRARVSVLPGWHPKTRTGAGAADRQLQQQQRQQQQQQQDGSHPLLGAAAPDARCKEKQQQQQQQQRAAEHVDSRGSSSNNNKNADAGYDRVEAFPASGRPHGRTRARSEGERAERPSQESGTPLEQRTAAPAADGGRISGGVMFGSDPAIYGTWVRECSRVRKRQRMAKEPRIVRCEENPNNEASSPAGEEDRMESSPSPAAEPKEPASSASAPAPAQAVASPIAPPPEGPIVEGGTDGENGKPIVVDGESDLGKKLLHCAQNGNARRLRWLLKRHTVDRDMLCEIMYHSIRANAGSAVVRVALRSLRKLNLPGYDDGSRFLVPDRCLPETLRASRATVLSEAVRFGTSAVARVLLEEGGADPNFRMVQECTCVLVACYHGSAELTELLLAHGSDASAQMDNGASPLAVACFAGHLDVVRALVDKGNANVNMQTMDGTTPLMLALQRGHNAVVDFLLSRGADVNLCKHNGSSPLIVAVRHKRVWAISRLADAGADPDLVLSNGASALVLACANGHVDIVERLLDSGADLTCRLTSGADALAYACHHGFLNVVVLAVPRHPSLQDRDVARLVAIAKAKGHDALTAWLERFRSERDSFGPLHFACSLDRVSQVLPLLQAHANFTPADETLLRALAGPESMRYVHRALQPFSPESADLWPSHFRATARAVLDYTHQGIERHIALNVLSFCNRDWFAP